MAKPSQHLLRKLIGTAEITGNSVESFVFSAGANQSDGWEFIDAGANNQFLVYRGYIDIAGLNAQELTTFILGTTFQESSTWLANGLTATGAIHTWDLLTTEKVRNEAFNPSHSTTGHAMWNPPGMPASDYNLQQVVYGRYRTLSPDTTVQSQVVITNNQTFGTGDATAGDKLYITRVVLLSGNLGNTGTDYITVPPTAVVIPAITLEEPDLVYLERLRRSYILAENR